MLYVNRETSTTFLALQGTGVRSSSFPVDILAPTLLCLGLPMKWFKHMTDASRDERLSALRHEKGLVWYARYWLILEAISELMDESDRCSATYRNSHWAVILGCKPGQVPVVARTFDEYGLVLAHLYDGSTTLECRNLLKIRARHKPIGSKRCRTDTDTDTDTDKEKKKIAQSSEKQPTGPLPIHRRITLDKNFEWDGFEQEDMDFYSESFPRVDLRKEFNKMASWIKADPKRRKRNWAKFIHNWLSKAQDRGF